MTQRLLLLCFILANLRCDIFFDSCPGTDAIVSTQDELDDYSECTKLEGVSIDSKDDRFNGLHKVKWISAGFDAQPDQGDDECEEVLPEDCSSRTENNTIEFNLLSNLESIGECEGKRYCSYNSSMFWMQYSKALEILHPMPKLRKAGEIRIGEKGFKAMKEIPDFASLESAISLHYRGDRLIRIGDHPKLKLVTGIYIHAGKLESLPYFPPDMVIDEGSVQLSYDCSIIPWEQAEEWSKQWPETDHWWDESLNRKVTCTNEVVP